MNRPILYFILWMLMHIPVISQPADGYNADWKTDSTAEYHQADLSRLDIAAP